MKPTRFAQMTNLLTAPTGMEDSVQALAVYADGNEVISKWRLSMRERLSALLFGTVWLRVLTPTRTQPPVSLQAQRTVWMDRPKRHWFRRPLRLVGGGK